MSGRIYGKTVDLNIDKVKTFWEERSKKYDEENPYVSMKFSDKNPSYANEWDEYEKKKILPELKLNENSYVLDIGCGIGRLSEAILPTSKYYLGTDFSDNLISIAKERIKIKKEFDFISLPFQQLTKHTPDIKYVGQYNRVIIAGVLIYMNDEDIKLCMNNLLELLDKDCVIYISTTTAVEKRLTLQDWKSKDFELEYNAIYRTEEEYKELFLPLLSAGFQIRNKGKFLITKNCNSETKHQYFVLARGEEYETK